MKKYNLFDIKQAKYSSFSTRVMIEISICIVIFWGICIVTTINHELIGEIEEYLQGDIQWKYVYDTFIELKNRILH
ncbi:MAG: hypothetical protein RR309_09090 [Cellulosilyticaceae bacterium]